MELALSRDRSEVDDWAYNPGDNGGDPISDDAVERLRMVVVVVWALDMVVGREGRASGPWNKRQDSRCSASRFSRRWSGRHRLCTDGVNDPAVGIRRCKECCEL